MSNQHGPEGNHPGRSHVTLQAMRSRVQPGSFPLLLGALLLLYVLNGVAVDLPANGIVGRVAVACAGLYVLSASRTTLWLGVLVFALWISFEARLWTVDPWVNRVLLDTITTGFLLWVLVVVLREVFRPRTKEVDAVVGALCGFLLICPPRSKTPTRAGNRAVERALASCGRPSPRSPCERAWRAARSARRTESPVERLAGRGGSSPTHGDMRVSRSRGGGRHRGELGGAVLRRRLPGECLVRARLVVPWPPGVERRAEFRRVLPVL